ncbi:MAG: hypothetical protein KAS15_06795, partial [Nanoarchaeota archaeon]|nr:hypothetical protein [Nanoarchaeota archaeon]
MHQKEAMMILTEELVRHSGISIVRENWYKKELIKKSKCFYQSNDPIMINYNYYDKIFFEDKPEQTVSGWFFSNTNQNLKKTVCITIGTLMKKIESCKGANYFFVDDQFQNKSSESLNTSHFFVTPYSIIGEDEIIGLKKLFYKDALPQIQGAMDLLSIENYADVYSLYANNRSLDLTDTAVKTFLNSWLHFDYLNDSGNKNITVIGIENLGDLDLLNSEFKKIGLKSRLDTTKYRLEKTVKDYPKRINKKNIKEVVNEIEQKSFLFAQGDSRKELLKNFWDFVFTIPYDDQNIESNQAILKSHAGEIDYINILG